MSELKKYMSVSEYAKTQKKKDGRIGIGTAAVYHRAERGRLILVKVNGILLVDTESYKPGDAGRPKKAKQ